MNQKTTKPPLFDIENSNHYEYDKPRDRTRSRLTEIAECGMQEMGIAEFGYEGVMSGLYIEKVWRFSDEEFKDYMDWAKQLIQEKNIRIQEYKDNHNQ